MVIMKKYIVFLILSVFVLNGFAQEDEKEKSEPVYETFASAYLIDNQTIFIPDAKTLEFAIQHKFGTFGNGLSDLFGIYSSSNIRLALNYVPVKNLQVGAGLARLNMTSDVNAKWTFLTQTTDNSIPVSVALYGIAAIDGRNEDDFSANKTHQPGEGLAQYSIRFSDRISYFSQVIVARKFNDWLSLQGGASFSHFNMVESDEDHDKIALHLNGKIKFSPQSSFIFNLDHPLKIKSLSEQREWTVANNPLPNISFGWEIATYTHAFQIYIGTSSSFYPQDVVMFNGTGNQSRKWLDKEILRFGFNITRLWMF